MIRKAVFGGIAAIALATLNPSTGAGSNNCAEHRYHANGEMRAQQFVGGKCIYYYANDSKQELLIYEPNRKMQNVGTLTQIQMDNQNGQTEATRYAVRDIRKGPHPDDTNYEYIHELKISQEEIIELISLLQKYWKMLSLNQKIEI